MIYEAIRNLQLQNTTAVAANNATLAQPLNQSAKSLGLDDTQTVSGNENAYLASSQDKNSNHIEDTKELPAVVSEGQKKNIGSPFEKTHGSKRDGFEGKVPQCQCETCRKRRYQDDSDDSGVSCQSPTKMSPTAAAFKVKSHEMEHVRREQMKAKEEGKMVISQSVRIKRDVCEECGRSYVSGGETVTVTRPDLSKFRQMFSVGAEEKLTEEKFDSIA